jgi:hypothetical protein
MATTTQSAERLVKLEEIRHHMLTITLPLYSKALKNVKLNKTNITPHPQINNAYWVNLMDNRTEGPEDVAALDINKNISVIYIVNNLESEDYLRQKVDKFLSSIEYGYNLINEKEKVVITRHLFDTIDKFEGIFSKLHTLALSAIDPVRKFLGSEINFTYTRGSKPYVVNIRALGNDQNMTLEVNAGLELNANADLYETVLDMYRFVLEEYHHLIKSWNG